MQPPASLKALADPIYEVFYGLSDQPFAITTDPKFFYLSLSHQRAFSELLNGLRRREGMLLLTGDTGTGKTTLCRTVLESLGHRTFSALILNPYMSGAEVFRIVLRDFGLVSHEELRRGALATADVPQLLDTLEGFLRSLVSLESHAVIVLDEAQSMAPQVLDQIRLLTALEQNNRRLVQVVLCGQPTLLATLKAESMLALNERITRRVTLAPLGADEVDAYIQHRLAVAGGADAVSFDAQATRLVADLAHGLPRRINVLCDRALQEGRIAGAKVMTSDLVKRAARSLAGVHEPEPVPPPPDQPISVAATMAAPELTPAVHTESHAEIPGFLTFGQPQAGAGRSRTTVVALILAGALAVGALGYTLYARNLVSHAGTAPPSPGGPVRDIGRPAQPLATPNEEQMRQMFEPAPATPRPQVAPAATPATAPSAPPPGSGQLPNNSN